MKKFAFLLLAVCLSVGTIGCEGAKDAGKKVKDGAGAAAEKVEEGAAAVKEAVKGDDKEGSGDGSSD